MQVKSIFVFGALCGPFVFLCVVLSISSHEWANMGFHLHVAQFYQKTLIPLKERKGMFFIPLFLDLPFINVKTSPNVWSQYKIGRYLQTWSS